MGAAGALRAAGLTAAAAALVTAVVVPVEAARPAPPEPLATSASYEEAAARLGACPESDGGWTWRNARFELGRVTEWREVIDATGDPGLHPLGHAEHLAALVRREPLIFDDVALTVKARNPAPGPVRRLSPHRLVVRRSMLAGLEWSLRSGAKAYVALENDWIDTDSWAVRWEPLRAAYLLVRHPDGRHFFAGLCEGERMTDPVRAALGSRYDKSMAAIVGKTGDDLAAVLD